MHLIFFDFLRLCSLWGEWRCCGEHPSGLQFIVICMCTVPIISEDSAEKVLWWSGQCDHGCWKWREGNKMNISRYFWRHVIPFLAPCQCVSKPLNVNQCQPIDSFTLIGSQNCKQNVLNINVLFFQCCASSSVFCCISSRAMWTASFMSVFSYLCR